MPESKAESLLVADCGSVQTKVGLVALAGGEYRFVGVGSAATTVEPPAANLVTGVRRAVEQMELRTHRQLLDQGGQLVTPEHATGQGVDAFAATTSAAQPLSVAVVGLSRGFSLASAVRAVNGTYAVVQSSLALDETGGRWLRPEEAGESGKNTTNASAGRALDPAVVAAEKLARSNPDVIVLVGGIDGGARSALGELAGLVAAITASREEGTRPIILFAGNRQARSQIVKRLGELTTLRVIDNVHPDQDRENLRPLQRELESLYIERKLSRVPGLTGLSSWTKAPVIPAACAFEHTVRFLSRRYDLNVWGADIGGTSTTLVTAHGDGYSRLVRSDLGMGLSLAGLAAQAGREALARWIPVDLGADLMAHLMNHALHPAAVPATKEEGYCLQAALRYALSAVARQAEVEGKGTDLILLSGSAMSRSANWGSLALMALDALQPQGVMTLAVDAIGLAPAFGAMAAVDAQAAAGVIEHDAFVTLGTVIAPTSTNREGQIDLRVKLTPRGGGAIELDVEHGSLEVVPLAPGEKAALEVHVAGGAALGPASHGVYKAQIEGGMLGLVIDARGRPIVLPEGGAERRVKVQKWFWDMGA